MQPAQFPFVSFTDSYNEVALKLSNEASGLAIKFTKRLVDKWTTLYQLTNRRFNSFQSTHILYHAFLSAARENSTEIPLSPKTRPSHVAGA